MVMAECSQPLKRLLLEMLESCCGAITAAVGTSAYSWLYEDYFTSVANMMTILVFIT